MRESEPFDNEFPESADSCCGSRTTPSQTQSPPELKCSFCGKSYRRDQTKNPPFCSTRCQQLDLRNWLNESYGLPVEGAGEKELPPDEGDEGFDG